MRDLISPVKRGYAGLARGVLHRLEASGRLGAAPPRERRGRHWAYSLLMVHDSQRMAALDVPWWTYDAIDAVEEWLGARPGPVRVFEYGSGASTVWLARRVAEVHSVEHHRGFAESMAPEFARHPNVDLRVVEPVASADPSVGSSKEGYGGLDFAAYVAAIEDVPPELDLVVIDGRAREACLAAAAPRLTRGGLVVFDNSRRHRYRQAIRASGLREQIFRGLTPTLPYPEQTSLLTGR